MRTHPTNPLPMGLHCALTYLVNILGACNRLNGGPRPTAESALREVSKHTVGQATSGGGGGKFAACHSSSGTPRTRHLYQQPRKVGVSR